MKFFDIWIEVDEHQHEERVCELNRLNEMLITRGWQMRPLVVLRLNVVLAFTNVCIVFTGDVTVQV